MHLLISKGSAFVLKLALVPKKPHKRVALTIGNNLFEDRFIHILSDIPTK